jgi:uncharacterized protein
LTSIQPMTSPLSDSEMDELQDLLENEVCSDNSMPMDVLDGYFYALAVGPVPLTPREWLPKVWGTDGEAYPRVKNEDKLDRLLELVTRSFNSIIDRLSSHDESGPGFVFPILEDTQDEYYDASGWAVGFMQGVHLCLEAWEPLLKDPEKYELLIPMFLLASTAFEGDEEHELARTPQQRHELALTIPYSVEEIRAFWLNFTHSRYQETESKPKAKRNATCSCGSNKKYKKCCGSPSKLH